MKPNLAPHAALRRPDPAWALFLGLFALASLLLDACKTTMIDGTQVAPNAVMAGTSEADPKKRAAVRVQLAADYYQSGQLQIAISTVRQAIELDPDSAQAHGLLALLLMDTGQSAQADASFQRALDLDRDNPDLNNNYGWFLCQTGHERDSLAYFAKAYSARLYQTPARALQNAGICLVRLHRNDEAEKFFLRALATDASSPVAKYQLAQLYLHERRFDRCEFYFNLLVSSVEANPDVLWLGARIAHARNDPATERSYAEQLESRFPNSAQAGELHRGHYDD